jgi:hypothetical protein
VAGGCASRIGRQLRHALQALLVALLPALPIGLVTADAARAQAVEVIGLGLARDDGALTLDVALRVTLPRPVEDALHRGVPLHFAAEAEVYRARWYWRDERIERVRRAWRLSYQPLTGSYRVTLGALAQNHPTLGEAMGSMTRLARWRLAEASRIDPAERHYVEFSWRLDTSQLPRPMQIGIGAQADWVIAIERTMELAP